MAVSLNDVDKSIIRICAQAGRGGLAIPLGLACKEYGLYDDVRLYLTNNSNPDVDDLADFIISLCPPIEIVDDEEE